MNSESFFEAAKQFMDNGIAYVNGFFSFLRLATVLGSVLGIM